MSNEHIETGSYTPKLGTGDDKISQVKDETNSTTMSVLSTEKIEISGLHTLEDIKKLNDEQLTYLLQNLEEYFDKYYDYDIDIKYSGGYEGSNISSKNIFLLIKDKEIRKNILKNPELCKILNRYFLGKSKRGESSIVGDLYFLIEQDFKGGDMFNEEDVIELLEEKHIAENINMYGIANLLGIQYIGGCSGIIKSPEGRTKVLNNKKIQENIEYAIKIWRDLVKDSIKKSKDAKEYYKRCKDCPKESLEDAIKKVKYHISSYHKYIDAILNIKSKTVALSSIDDSKKLEYIEKIKEDLKNYYKEDNIQYPSNIKKEYGDSIKRKIISGLKDENKYESTKENNVDNIYKIILSIKNNDVLKKFLMDKEILNKLKEYESEKLNPILNKLSLEEIKVLLGDKNFNNFIAFFIEKFVSEFDKEEKHINTNKYVFRFKKQKPFSNFLKGKKEILVIEI